MTNLHALGFVLPPHPAKTPDLALSDFFLFSDLMIMLTGQKCITEEVVIVETEAYFEAKDKLYYTNDTKKLYGGFNRCIAPEDNSKIFEFVN